MSDLVPTIAGHIVASMFNTKEAEEIKLARQALADRRAERQLEFIPTARSMVASLAELKKDLNASAPADSAMSSAIDRMVEALAANVERMSKE